MLDRASLSILPSSAAPDLKCQDFSASLNMDLKIAIDAAKHAGEIIRAAYCTGLSAEFKGFGDPVCGADYAADKCIREFLERHCPGDYIISEESNPGYECSNRRTWIIDPLDGTSSFLSGRYPNQPSVMVALVVNGNLESASVYFPMTDECFYAGRGLGAFKNGQAIRMPTDLLSLPNSEVVLNHYADAAYETSLFNRLARTLRSPAGAGLVTVQAPHSGISLRLLEHPNLFAVVHDNNPAKPKQCLWDVAAPKLIVEEAGGAFLNSKLEPYRLWETDLIVVSASLERATAVLQLYQKS